MTRSLDPLLGLVHCLSELICFALCKWCHVSPAMVLIVQSEVLESLACDSRTPASGGTTVRPPIVRLSSLAAHVGAVYV